MRPADTTGGAVTAVVARALTEDLSDVGDVTTMALIPDDVTAEASVVVARGVRGVVAGTDAAAEVFRQVDDTLDVHWCRQDAEIASDGDAVCRVSGRLRSILTAERTALNFLGHLSGVATLTRRFVEAVGPGVTVLDTRKTTPGLRALEKAAVRAGGGANHRMGLYDGVMAKDNHLARVSIADAVERARRVAPGLMVEIECDTLAQVGEAVAAGADRVLLDNMTPEQVAEAVSSVAGACEVEVSGGITLDNVAAYAAAGPDFVSVGALTHSAPSLDLSMVVVS